MKTLRFFSLLLILLSAVTAHGTIIPLGTNFLTVGYGAQYTTITAAKNAAVAGQMIAVMPGTYTENNLLKAGVNYFFYPGSSINYTCSTVTLADGLGIFDDRGTGATTNKIGGLVDIYYSIGTNLNGACHGNTNSLGPVINTNSSTDLYFEYHSIDGDAFCDCNTVVINGVTASPALFYIARTRNAELRGSEMLCSRILDTQNGVGNVMTGLYWERGQTYCKASHMAPFPFYGIWPNTQVDAVENMWVTIDLCEGYIYTSMASAKNRVWYDFKEVRVTNSLTKNAFGFIGGRHYVRAEKISATETNGTGMNVTGGAEVWLSVQKITAADSGLYIKVDGATNHALVQHYEQTTRLSGNGLSVINGGVLDNGLNYTSLKTLTNSSFAPDFNLGSSETNIGAAFTLSLPLNVDATAQGTQTTVFVVRTNGTAGSPFALTSPTGVKGTGTAYVTNTTIVTVYVYGKEYTNYNYNPIY